MKSPARTDIEAARRSLETRLATLPPERLIAFVARLADEDPRVHRQILDLFATQKPAGAIAQRIEKRMAKVFATAPKYRWHEADALGAELDEVLDLIERGLLPAAPTLAFAALAEFIGRDSAAMESADDSYGEIGMVFRRACELFAAASKHVSSPEALPVWERLIEGDAYGCRGELPRLMVTGLAAPEVDAVIAILRERMRTGDERAGATAAPPGIPGCPPPPAVASSPPCSHRKRFSTMSVAMIPSAWLRRCRPRPAGATNSRR